MVLPSDGVELKENKNYQPKYQRVDFRAMLEKSEEKKIVQKIAKVDITNSINITNMLLKGLYGTSTKGYAIVALKSKASATSIVAVGEKFSGYTLKSIASQGIVFTKNSQDYILKLKVSKNKKSSIIRVNKTNNTSREVTDVEDGEPREVNRKDIDYFAKHPREIWKNISIHDVKRNRKIIGFKISRINPNSKFAALGLKRGDLIVRANNIELKSYKNAIELYNNINKIDTMQIVVIRNNEEKELIYEIN